MVSNKTAADEKFVIKSYHDEVDLWRAMHPSWVVTEGMGKRLATTAVRKLRLTNEARKQPTG